MYLLSIYLEKDSSKRDSIPQSSDYEPDALPIELPWLGWKKSFKLLIIKYAPARFNEAKPRRSRCCKRRLPATLKTTRPARLGFIECRGAGTKTTRVALHDATRTRSDNFKANFNFDSESAQQKI